MNLIRTNTTMERVIALCTEEVARMALKHASKPPTEEGYHTLSVSIDSYGNSLKITMSKPEEYLAT